ncbi:hypothetical protein GCM10012275_47950 [Longimycelium tulufanense]|uniref:Putative zinc-finger domain-containing protein n=1 Tax=Longimycelium tulufanense TaxID=907463 RepID=A0A8J3CID4_9PSEU|nr:zf-HC2 domain-containing protein [Longimycelium tulufanense]GGM71848.1 hypothetical protein GCM10012275_47950 [Longimycelium tulufanense]
MTPPSHIDVAAYALGVLDPDDAETFEEHLVDCPRCRSELVELAVLPDLLEQARRRDLLIPAPSETAEDGAGALQGALDRVVTLRRRRRRTLVFAAAAAATLVVAAPVINETLRSSPPTHDRASTTTSIPPDPPQPLEAAQTLVGFNPANRTNARLTIRTGAWGTGIDMELKGVRGPLRCELVAVSRGGETHSAGGWRVPDKGYGVPGSPDPLQWQGGVALSAKDIERFEVRTDRGDTLVQVPNNR